MIANRPLRRARPWIRYIARVPGRVRVMRCFHCRKKQTLTFEAGVTAAAKAERAFVNEHKACAWPIERTPRVHPYDLTLDKMTSILQWAEKRAT